MSDCDVIRMEFGAYVLGLLDPDDNQRVAAHLLGCRRCRAEVAELQETSALLGHSNGFRCNRSAPFNQLMHARGRGVFSAPRTPLHQHLISLLLR